MTEITNVRIKSNVHDACKRERDELRAEVERLRDIAWKHGNRADEAEAENERLKAELKECEKNLTIWEAPDDRW